MKQPKLKSAKPSRRVISFLHGFVGINAVLRIVMAIVFSLSASNPLAPLFVQHAVAASMIGGLLYLGRVNLVIFLMAAELSLLSIRLAYLLGVEPLFHIYALALSPIALLFEHIPRLLRAAMVLLPIVGTLCFAVLPINFGQFEHLIAGYESTWSFTNLALFLVLCLWVILYYMRATQEQWQLAESLLQQRTRLIADMSHELKTPLASILAKAQVTLSRTRSEAEYQAALELCERNARQLRELTTRMLTYIDAEGNQIAPDLQKIELKPFLDACVTDLSLLAAQRDFHLIAVCPVEHSVQSDPVLLRIILQNLIGNALQHATGGSCVQVIASADLPLVLSVEDDGPGIATDQLPLIFQPFHRVSTARSRTEGSVGLGLSITMETARRLGCRIEAENVAPHGMRFDLHFF